MSVSTADIRAAGGLEKWLARENKKITRESLMQQEGSSAEKQAYEVRKPQAYSWDYLSKMPGISKKPTPGKMNRWESEYAKFLCNCMFSEEIAGFKFEAFRLSLGGGVQYIPDFFVLENDESFSVHEVKGFWRDDARVKFKIAADRYPQFRFYECRKIGDLWDIRKKIGGGA